MSSQEWGILIGVVAIFAAPTVISGVAIFVKLSSVALKLDFTNSKLTTLEAENRRLCESHGNHEGRLDTHAILLTKIIERMNIDKPAGI